MPHSLLKAPPQQAFFFSDLPLGGIFPTGAPPDPSNSAPLQLARRVHKRSLVRQTAEHVEVCVPEKAAGILPKRPEPAPCQRRLLLAEDDVETRRLLGAALRRQGFEVEACDGVELLEHISSSADEYRLAVDGIVVRAG